MFDTIKSARPGDLVTVRADHSESIDPILFFSKLSNFGAKKHSLLVEFKDRSIGSVSPSLVFSGNKDDFSITALNETGKRILLLLRKKVDGKFSKDTLSGKIAPLRKNMTDDQKAKARSHFDLFRAALDLFEMTSQSNAGLYGMFSSELVEPNGSTLPDYIVYLVDSMFVAEPNRSYFESNVFITEGKRDALVQECQKKLKAYEKPSDKKPLKKQSKKNISVSYDLSDQEFNAVAKDIKKQIIHGVALQANPSRLMTINAEIDPLILYSHLKQSHEGYRFFMNTDHGVFMGTQPNVQLDVAQGELSFTSVSTSRPRGTNGEGLEADLDSKREMRIWADKNEMIKHTMYLDAARNVSAGLCNYDSQRISEMFKIQKEPQFQFLFSTVNGKLRESRDCFHALSDSLSFESGIPRQAALSMLRKLEKTPRNFHGGSFVYISFSKDLQSVLLEPIHIHKNAINVRTSSYVMHDSVDDLQKSLSEERALVRLIKIAGGFK